MQQDLNITWLEKELAAEEELLEAAEVGAVEAEAAEGAAVAVVPAEEDAPALAPAALQSNTQVLCKDQGTVF